MRFELYHHALVLLSNKNKISNVHISAFDHPNRASGLRIDTEISILQIPDIYVLESILILKYQYFVIWGVYSLTGTQ